MNTGDSENAEITTVPHLQNLEDYTICAASLERLHRLLLDLVKLELDSAGVTQVNNIQALLLYNIGDAEMTAGELRSRGHYLGSNVSYNLKKLVQAGFIHHERSVSDRRSVRVRLTGDGHRVRNLVRDMYNRQAGLLKEAGIIEPNVLNDRLTALEGFWQDQLNHRRQVVSVFPQPIPGQLMKKRQCR